MQLIGVFPNVEKALIGWLKSNLPDVAVYSELPLSWNPPTDPLPAILVQRIPAGSGGQEYESTPVLDINLYAADRSSLWDLVQQVEPIIVNFPRQSAAAAYVDNLVWHTPFGFMSYENRAVRRAFGSVELLTRPQSVKS